MLRSLAVTAFTLLFAGPASAQLIVYRGAPDCNSNVTPGTIPIGPGSTNILVCFDDPGGGVPVTGQECVGNTADEVCGLDLEIRSTGSVTLNSFTPSGDWVFSLTPTLIKTNGGNPLTGDAVPMPAGTVNVTATGPGTVEVTGKNWVDSSLLLQTVTPVVLATAATVDFDGDGIPDATDSCPTIADATNGNTICTLANTPLPCCTGAGTGSCGIDADGDGVNNACDNCPATANAPVPAATALLLGRAYTSRQLDDDLDGRGNICDFDYNNAGLSVGTNDFNDGKASQGKSLSATNCGQTLALGGSGDISQRCYEFDHFPAASTATRGLSMTTDDFNALKAAQGKSMGLFPRCPGTGCTAPFSRPLAAGPATVGKATCETGGGTAPACPY